MYWLILRTFTMIFIKLAKYLWCQAVFEFNLPSQLMSESIRRVQRVKLDTIPSVHSIKSVIFTPNLINILVRSDFIKESIDTLFILIGNRHNFVCTVFFSSLCLLLTIGFYFVISSSNSFIGIIVSINLLFGLRSVFYVIMQLSLVNKKKQTPSKRADWTMLHAKNREKILVQVDFHNMHYWIDIVDDNVRVCVSMM